MVLLGSWAGQVGVSAAADKAGPRIVCAAADGEWHAENVAVRCTASAARGLDDRRDAAFVLRTAVPPGAETATAATNARRVCDRAGDCATAGPVLGNQVDRRPPEVLLVRPAQGGRYGLFARHGVDFSCTDAGSQMSYCQSTAPVETEVPTGPAALGPQHFTVIGKDRAGNRTKVRHEYRVEIIVPGDPL